VKVEARRCLRWFFRFGSAAGRDAQRHAGHAAFTEIGLDSSGRPGRIRLSRSEAARWARKGNEVGCLPAATLRSLEEPGAAL